jgi:hypothetical protein
MAGYIGSKASVTQVDGYNRAEADAEFVDVTGDTMTGALAVNGNLTVDTNTLFVDAASNNVGIGEASPDAKLHIRDATDGGSVSVTSAIQFSRRNGGANDAAIKMQHDGSDGISNLQFHFGASERMRIDASGRLLLGKTTTDDTVTGVKLGAVSGDNTFCAGNGFAWGLMVNRQADNGSAILFRRGNTDVGSISVTATNTSYNTSSDYRLKEDVQPMVGSVDRLMALKPVNFAWKASGERVDGFLAHEAQEVVPEAITGSKDAVDDEGNPQYQGIDQSKLVPLLTAALQEALTKIEALEARMAVLEGGAA